MKEQEKMYSTHTCPCDLCLQCPALQQNTPRKKRKWLGDFAVALVAVMTLVWFVCALALPQTRPKGTRYDGVQEIHNGDVKMVAHRGLSGMELENTLPAFELAGQNEYYGIEADVRVTADGKYIITHDDDLTRIVKEDLVIEETTFDALRALTFESPYGDEGTYQLPTLEEYVSVCKQYDKQAVLEYKGAFTAEQAAEVAATVETMGWFDRTTFISFSRDNLLYLRAAYPSADAQYIVEKATKADIDWMIEHKIDADLCWISVNPFRVKRLHDAGLKVNVWTVDGTVCAYLAMLFGVDMITTNILV